MNVNNLTTSEVLFSEVVTTDAAETYYIPTPVGDDISVDFKLAVSTTHGGFDPRYTRTSSIDYSMATAVAPEPISSILFLTGGATLGIRRFRKSKKAGSAGLFNNHLKRG